MTNEQSIEVVIKHARNAVEEAENDDGWVMIKAPMLSELIGEIERLRAAAEPTPPPCKHDQGSGVIDSSGNGEFTCHKCGHVQKFGRGLSENRGADQ